MLRVHLEICDRSCPVHKDATCNHLVWIQIQPQSEGRQKEGFVSGCSDLFRFSSDLRSLFSEMPRFVPFSSDLRSLFSGMPRFVPSCSDLLRFLFRCVFRTNLSKSGKPPSPATFASPRLLRKLLPATGVVWALQAQSWKKSPKMSSRGLLAPAPKKSKTESKPSRKRV